MIESAKSGAEEIAVRTLMALGGMDAAQARQVIDSMTQKSNMIDFANDLTYEDMVRMVPDYDDIIADLEAQAQAFMGNVGNDPASRKTLEDAGYTFDSSNRVMRDGRLLSDAELSSTFATYFRADAAVELNTGIAGTGYQFNGIQLRAFIAYTGTDEHGNKKIQLRFRVLDEARFADGTSAAGVDGGLFTSHDLVLQWAVPKDGKALKGNVLWNSTLGLLGEANAGVAGVANYFGQKVNGTWPGLDPRWNQADAETGVGWGMTASYNLTKMGDDWWQPMLSEVGGMVMGGSTAAEVLLFGEVASGASATELIYKYGLTAVNAGAQIGAFAADLAFAQGDENQEEVSVSNGFFAWGDIRAGTPSGTLGESGVGVQGRFRIQINAGNTPWNMF